MFFADNVLHCYLWVVYVVADGDVFMSGKPLVIVSSCLLGHATRYDGRSKPSPVLLTELAPCVNWLPVCPEADSGMGTPRPPMQVVRFTNGECALERPADGFDPTPMLKNWIDEVMPMLLAMRPDAAILKARSPSCGLGTTKIFPPGERNTWEIGHGMFAAALRKEMPKLLIVDENELDTPEKCQQFLRKMR